ncbi:MAG: hypothetical protein A2W93_12120 [Bacteroidetes bacterium GWF2_43_63]|nr:MAG: hypothetical protein A2W94_15610 [Bacteroidetes bacterium GWE2_42_42]OFY56368.1 MAG: hypothetical protein A2W93_12120 [Bacteroidetes bacterium GWF2_43_63]
MILTNRIVCNKGESRSAFAEKVKSICEKLAINPNWLMVVMLHESGINAQAVNKQKGDHSDACTRSYYRATGLIQFMPTTAMWLGTSTQALYKMNNLQQLDYVYKYFKPYSGRIKSYYDLYMITFWPAAIGKPDNYVIQSSTIPASVVAERNPSLDINRDGKITVGEAKQIMLKAIPVEFLNDVLSDDEKKSSGS